MLIPFKMSTFAPMIDERMYDLLRSQLAVANDEKAGLCDQIKSLTEEIGILRSTLQGENALLRSTVSELSSKVGYLLEILQAKDARISSLETELLNAHSQVKLGRKQRYARSSEQQQLLNNNASDLRGEDKDKFDGTPGSPVAANEAPGGVSAAQPEAGVSKKDKVRKRILRGDDVDSDARCVSESVYHKLEDYYTLPAGGHYMTRKGAVETTLYRIIRMEPARIIEDIYEVASVVLSDDSIVRTMGTPHVVGRCPLSAGLLSFILCEKYAYHSSINTVKKKLRNMGAVFSKSTLNRYYQLSIGELKDFLEATLHEETRKTDYLMIDETCELVGVTDEAGHKSYKKKYLWAFFAKLKNLVSYVYEHGSRSREVVLKFLKDFCGSISTDGYVAYSIFDDAKKYPSITHVGCWAHARRLFIEAYESEKSACRDVINDIGDLFSVELNARLTKIDPGDIERLRKTESNSILTRIYTRVKTMSKNHVLMSNGLMKKAVNYLLNQWHSLRNFIMDGRVQVSNNLCEQRMKTIKLDLKNCQNIGSEDAAMKAAFMHSLIESCSLNKLNPESYLTHLFECHKRPDVVDKAALLPCYFTNKV